GAGGSRGAVERAVLAEPPRRPAVPLLRDDRVEGGAGEALALLQRGDALGGAADVHRCRGAAREPPAEGSEFEAASDAAAPSRRLSCVPARATPARIARFRSAGDEDRAQRAR